MLPRANPGDFIFISVQLVFIGWLLGDYYFNGPPRFRTAVLIVLGLALLFIAICWVVALIALLKLWF